MMLSKCATCVNTSNSRSAMPCSTCRDNDKYTSHYHPHAVYLNLLSANAVKPEADIRLERSEASFSNEETK